MLVISLAMAVAVLERELSSGLFAIFAGYLCDLFSYYPMGFYMFSEYAAMFFSSAFISVLFFGGYCYPGMDWVAENWGTNIDALFGFAAIFGKTLFFMFVYIWVRWTIPRFRYDQLMNLGWKVLFPLSVINIFIIAFVKLIF